jgi:ubiquinone/menaquinone biosynthesis C-methylase UbiE
MSALRQLLQRHPRVKAAIKKVMRTLGIGNSVSSRYVPVPEADAQSEAARLRDAWQADELPQRQRALVDQQLTAWRRGEAIDVFDVMVQALRGIVGQEPAQQRLSLLEVGCSSGFYSEVVQGAGVPVDYSGCDYSDAFVALARQTYPHILFGIEDATALKHADASVDIVVSGCCLLHIPEYRTAVAETARVARRWAIFHRTPMVIGEPDRYYRKLAYGIETVEIHFNEPAFLALLEANGLKVIETFTLAEDVQQGAGTANRTYVCEKVPTP